MRSAALRLLENDPPTLLSVATALPDFRLDQRAVASVALRIFDREKSEIDRLMPVFENAGISSRHSCVTFEWYAQPHGWRERNALYLEHATRLLREAAARALTAAGRTAGDIAGVVAVSTTGIATPSLDAVMINALGLSSDVQRLPVFGLGCAAASSASAMRSTWRGGWSMATCCSWWSSSAP
jgi:alkylresorcinol/alkylpyrone synthase